MRVLATAPVLALLACSGPDPAPGVCGNGVAEPDFDEECDAGEGNAPEGPCTPKCKLPACGDGVIQGAEECDLGDKNSESGLCTTACKEARCGDDYVLSGVEQCDDGDDGNKAFYDGIGGCSTNCTPYPYCGDGLIGAPYEDCDDGNNLDGDGCNHLCQKSVCGDGIVDVGEMCDDGNKSDTDACLSTCVPAKCGDGFVQDGVEECDDGNANNNDACLTVCLAAKCGDGLVQTGVEECDDGNQVPDDGCDNACVRDRLVYVSEELFGPKSIGNLDGADLECRKIALANNQPNPTAFKAWLSNDSQSPATRFYKSTGRYVLVTGSVVADNWDDLTDGTLQHGIDRTLDGKLTTDKPVWTSTMPDGVGWGDGKHCLSWTTSDINTFGRQGVTGYSDAFWTDIDVELSCGNAGAIYCFEQF
ncbi:MAG: DUF4215 domain-containing protein [Nannocystaceae bacterium]